MLKEKKGLKQIIQASTLRGQKKEQIKPKLRKNWKKKKTKAETNGIENR